MPTLRTLTGDADAFLGGDHVPGLEVSIEHNLPVGQELIDLTNGKVLLGKKVAVSLNGSGSSLSVALPDTGSTDLNVEPGTLQYQVTMTYPSGGQRGEATWRSGWFFLTADADLADLATQATPVPADLFAAQKAELEAIRDETADIRDNASEITGLTGEDDAVALLLGSATDTRAAGDTRWTKVAARPVSAYDHGVRTDGANRKPELAAAFAAADLAGGGSVVELPPGVVTVDGGFSLSGYSSGLIGHGSTNSGPGASTVASGSVIKTISQTGPVLDFTGFVWPNNYLAKLRIGGFSLRGDGTAGAAKKGFYVPSVALGAHLFDITTLDTGGSGFDITDLYLSTAEGLACDDPVDCVANNVPYARFAGCNGSTIHILLRSRAGTTVSSVPAAGALLIAEPGTALHDAEIHPEFEALCADSGRALMVVTGRNLVIDDPKFFDCYKVSGASDTSHIRLTGAGTGNLVRGVIPARNTVATAIDYGVDLQSNGHRVEGVKAYRTHQVRLASGVEGCTVLLGGGWSPQTSDQVAIEDNSGSDKNTLIDFTTGVIKFGSMSLTPRLSGVGSVAMAETAATGVSGNAVINCNLGTHVKWTLTGNVTVNVPTNPKKGMRLTLQIAQDATGSRTASWNSVFKFAGGSAPALSTAANAVDIFEFLYDGTNWRELGRSVGT